MIASAAASPRPVARYLVAGLLAVAACGGSSSDGGDTAADGAGAAAATTVAVAGEPSENQTAPTTAAPTPTTALPEVNILTDFADVCRGVTLPGATAYDPARAGIHPVMYAVGEHPGYDDVIATMPEQWNPVTGQEQTTELVACLARTSETLVETCTGYQNDDGTDSGNSVEMYDATYDITLVAATTGEQVGATSMTATSGDCPMLFFFDEGEPVGVEHALPTDELTTWMVEFVQV